MKKIALFLACIMLAASLYITPAMAENNAREEIDRINETKDFEAFKEFVMRIYGDFIEEGYVDPLVPWDERDRDGDGNPDFVYVGIYLEEMGYPFFLGGDNMPSIELCHSILAEMPLYKVEYGHTLTAEEVDYYYESDLFFRPTEYTEYYEEPAWNIDPVGYTLTQDIIFVPTPVPTGELVVGFYDTFNHLIYEYRNVEKGACLEAPDIVKYMDEHPEIAGDFVYNGEWNTDAYKNVQSALKVVGVARYRGDTNEDEQVDAADAALTLRALVNESLERSEFFDRTADMNRNGQLDSADATLILRSCVEA